MSWPLPASSASSGPAIVLPWPSRELSRPSWSIPSRSMRSKGCKASVRKARYGIGMVAGLMVVDLTKRIINSIPVINLVTRPILDLVPTILVGPALGAAVVYGIEQGDLMAARHVVREMAGYVRHEFDTVVRDLSSELHGQRNEFARQLERSHGALEASARAASRSVEELERSVVPVIEREYRNIESTARRAYHEGNGASSGGSRGPPPLF